jgi:hypothetical protein
MLLSAPNFNGIFDVVPRNSSPPLPSKKDGSIFLRYVTVAVFCVVARLGVLPSIASASSVLSSSGMRFEVSGASRCGPDGVDSVGAEMVRVCSGFWEVFDGCKRGRWDGDIIGLVSSGALRGLVELGGAIGVLGTWYEGSK